MNGKKQESAQDNVEMREEEVDYIKYLAGLGSDKDIFILALVKAKTGDWDLAEAIIFARDLFKGLFGPLEELPSKLDAIHDALKNYINERWYLGDEVEEYVNSQAKLASELSKRVRKTNAVQAWLDGLEAHDQNLAND